MPNHDVPRGPASRGRPREAIFNVVAGP
jgi:hypothetical protein